MPILIDFTDTSDTAEPTVTLILGEDSPEQGEVSGPDILGGYTVQGITNIYQAVTQVSSEANDRAAYVAEKLQDAAHHGRLYLGSAWRISLVREG